MVSRFDTAIIGGGASGMIAGISAGRRQGKSAVILERLKSPGRKLLACGGGRCNFLNDKLDPVLYNPSSRGLVSSIFKLFGKKDIEEFFQDLGLSFYSDHGRIFPVTNQSASVLKVIELGLKRLAVPVETGFDVCGIRAEGKGFLISSADNRKISCQKLVIAAGGRSYPALGSNGSCYKFCRDFGHRIIEPVPSAVALETQDKCRHFLQGQKIFVCAKSLIDGKITAESRGELLFTKYGLSGTAILDISQDISMALNRSPGFKAEVLVDLVPFMDERQLKAELSGRIRKGLDPADLACGLLPNKFGLAFLELFKSADVDRIASGLKHKVFKILCTRGWNEAEFTCGGVSADEVDPLTLESRLKKGLYFCGEILDVQGPRGGYNLAWAFSSGFIAGLTG